MITVTVDYPHHQEQPSPEIKALYERIKELTRNSDIQFMFPVPPKVEPLDMDLFLQRNSKAQEIIRVEILKARSKFS